MSSNDIRNSLQNLNFDHFMGKFESYQNEFMKKEQALANFLNKNDPNRTSQQSVFTLESMRNSIQTNPMNLTIKKV